MKKILLISLLLLLPVSFQSCSKPESGNENQNSNSTTAGPEVNEATKDVLTEYFAYINKFDQANLGNMTVELTNFDQNKKNYDIICNLLTEAEAIQAKMNNVLGSTSDIRIQAQIKPYLEIMNARVAALKSNKATFQRFGAS